MTYTIRTLSTKHWTISREYFRNDGILHEYYVKNHGERVLVLPQTWDQSPPVSMDRWNAARWLKSVRKLGAARRQPCNCFS